MAGDLAREGKLWHPLGLLGPPALAGPPHRPRPGLQASRSTARPIPHYAANESAAGRAGRKLVRPSPPSRPEPVNRASGSHSSGPGEPADGFASTCPTGAPRADFTWIASLRRYKSPCGRGYSSHLDSWADRHVRGCDTAFLAELPGLAVKGSDPLHGVGIVREQAGQPDRPGREQPPYSLGLPLADVDRSNTSAPVIRSVFWPLRSVRSAFHLRRQSVRSPWRSPAGLLVIRWSRS